MTRWSLPLKFGCALMGISLLAGCGSPPQESTTPIAITLPESRQGVEAQSLKLSLVVINVTGPEINPPVFFEWSRCTDCPNPPPVPSYFGVSIPNGENRLIQVLAGYFDENKESMALYYNDVTTAVTVDNQIQSIMVQPVGAGSLIQGSIAGRIVSGKVGDELVGPTGEVRILFKPPNAPAMIVERDFIFSGWFNFFMLRGANLVYQLSDGTELFGGPVDFASDAMNPASYASGSVFKTWVPNHRRARQGGSLTWADSSAHIKMYGYFPMTTTGSLTSGLRVCTDLSGESSRMIKKADSFTQSLTMTAGAPPTGANLLSALGTAYFSGGEAIGNNTCGTLGVEHRYSRFLKITSAQIESVNREHEPIQGPFRQLATTGGGLDILMPSGSTTRRVRGHFLPGVGDGAASIADRVVVYKAVGAAVANYNFEKVPCGAIAAGLFYGYSFAGEGLVDSNGEFSVDTTISNSDLVSGVAAAVCPSKGGIVWAVGAPLSIEALGRCRGCEAAEADRLSVRIPARTIDVETCLPVEFELYNSLGRVAVNSQNLTVTPSLASGAVTSSLTFYDNRLCTGSPSAGLELRSNETRKTYYMKVATAAYLTDATLGFSASGLTGTSQTLVNVSDSALSPFTTSIDLYLPSTRNWGAGACRDIEVWSKASGGALSPFGANYDRVELGSVPAGAVSYHENCLRAMASKGTSSVDGLSVSNYFIPLVYRAEVPFPLDVSLRINAVDTSLLPDGTISAARVVYSPFSFEPVLWYRAESESFTSPGYWLPRHGEYSLSGCTGNCPSLESETFTTSGGVTSATFPYVGLADGDMANTSPGALNRQGQESTTLFALVRVTSLTTTGTLAKLYSSGSTVALGYDDVTASFFMTEGNISTATGTIGSAALTGLAPSYGTWRVLTVKRTRLNAGSAAFEFYINGVKQGSTLNQLTSSRDWDRIYIGSNGLNGAGIAELMVVDRALPDSDIQKFVDYMRFRSPFLSLP